MEINPADAVKLDVKDEGLLRVSSSRDTVRVAATNLLTTDAVDPAAKIPEFKVCAIKVEEFW